MLTELKIKKKLKATSVIKTITAAYQEISKKEMNEIREMTLQNRRFIEELQNLYLEARQSYWLEKKGEKSKYRQRKKNEPDKKAVKKKKSIAVFLSVNARFYGGLILRIWQETARFQTENGSDLAVVGEIGRQLVERQKLASRVYYFDLNDEQPRESEIRKIIELLKQYDEIKVFHGKFKTVLFQEIVTANLAGEITGQTPKETNAYLFEPSPEAVMEFFETELLTAFFSQAFLEHRLSRHATRMVRMYQAEEKAKERQAELSEQAKKIKWHLLDKKQQEISLIFQLWK